MDEKLDQLFNEAKYSGPVPISAINEAEEILGLIFPNSYRNFVTKFGAAFLDRIEIAGIQWPIPDPNNCPLWTNIVKATLAHRPKSAPENSIAISGDGCDITYHLICSKSDREFEGAVIEWGPGANHEVPFAPSFSYFCLNYASLYNGV